jgi:ABC-2 type transport system permease protein
MTALRGYPALTWAHLLELSRSRAAFFWTLVLPVLMTLVLGPVFGRGEPGRVMPSLYSLTIITGSFFSATFRMVAERQAGIFRRYRASPVTALTVVLAHATTAFVSMTCSLALQVAVSLAVFGTAGEGSAGALAAVLITGELAFIPLGLVVGSVARDARSAPALTHLIFFPMMFLSGAAVPFFLLPWWLQAAGRLVPATWFMEAVHRVTVQGGGLGAVQGPLVALLLTSAVGALANAMVFRWEGGEPLRTRRLLLAMGALGLVWVGAALALPDPSLATPPADPPPILGGWR